jgi:hypothetical protein
MTSLRSRRLPSLALAGAGALLAWLGLAPVPAAAVVAPFYGHVDILTREGLPTFATIEAVQAEGVGAIYRQAGQKFFCDTPNCGISIAPGANPAWGEVPVDPAAGRLGSRAGSLGYVAWSGYAQTYGYYSQTLRLDADGSLQPGTPVSVDLTLQLDGTMDDGLSVAAAGLLTVQAAGPAFDYVDGFGTPVDYMPVGTFLDLFYTPDHLESTLGYVRHQAGPNDSPVNFSGADVLEVAVGDVLFLEAMLFLTNEYGNSPDDIGQSLTLFGSSLVSGLTPITAGAVLNPVPLPPALALFVPALLCLGLLRRR